MQVDLEEIWRLSNAGHIEIEFDNGVVMQTNGRRTIFSRYIWEIHRQYSKLPILPSHHMGGMVVGTKTHLDLLAVAVWNCYDIYKAEGIDVDREHLMRLSYQITNMIYNDFSLNLEEYVTTISALDFVHVLKHEVIEKANKELIESDVVREADITKAHAIIKKVLLDPHELPDNTVAKAAKSGMVSMGQIIQCVSARGMATDIDSHIFRNAIRTGFAKGMHTLEDVLKESRSASKSLYFQKDPMRKSEYFNRNIQLSSATLCNLHHCDCGSTSYLPVTVSGQKLLKSMTGIHYLDPESQTEKTIHRDSSELVGRTIMIRSVLTCKHPDPYGVCVRCFGELGLSIPYKTNLGHVSASELQSKVAQLLLSNKHLDSSATSDVIRISEFDSQFINLGAEENSLYLSKNLVGKKFKLCISENEAPNLVDLKTVSQKDTDKLVPYRLSELSYIYFTVVEGDLEMTYPVLAASGTRLASLSRKMLKYIKRMGWTNNSDNQYEIDMSEWQWNQPIAELPLKHFSTVDYMLSIESFIKGGGNRGNKSIMSYEEPSAALMAFHDLVSLKLDCHLSYLQVIILATMVEDKVFRDYRLPTIKENGQTTHYRQQMRLRSLAAAMAYQSQADIIFSPESFIVTNRPKHPLDYLLME